jgi:hypothetical protein
MTSPRRFEHDLPVLLADLYFAGTPDYRDDLVQQVARVRQRPAWTFPERWLPMDLATKAVPGAPRIPWRIVGVVALLAILLAAMLAFYAGSQRPLPAPFGRAANGSVVVTEGGDIYTADPVTGTTTGIVVGPEIDGQPVFSLDGTRVAFERKVEGDGGVRPGFLFVVQDDGRGLVQVTPEPLSGLAAWSFSPDGRSIVALATRRAGPTIMVVASDGSGPPVFFDVGARLNDEPPRYRPDGTEIMFQGIEPGAGTRGLYALDPATGDVRTIIAPSATADVSVAAWSPDGTRIAYAVYDPADTRISLRTHVMSADGTGDVLVDTHPDSFADGGGGGWSNDGTRLIVNRWYTGADGDIIRSAIVPADGSSVGIDIECASFASPDACNADWIWSPDDSVILGVTSDASGQPLPQFLADPLTGKTRPAPWTATGNSDWQRRAP